MGKVNPRRRPATFADVKRAKKEAQDKGLNIAVVIMLSALLDKGFLEKDRMRDAWDAINAMADSIRRGYVDYNDLRRTLEEEYEIYV